MVDIIAHHKVKDDCTASSHNKLCLLYPLFICCIHLLVIIMLLLGLIKNRLRINPQAISDLLTILFVYIFFIVFVCYIILQS